MKSIDTEELVVVLRDRAQEWDFKHAQAPLLDEGCDKTRLPADFDRVWYMDTYNDQDDKEVLQNRFGERYKVLERQCGNGTIAVGDILMPVTDDAGQLSYKKIVGEEGERTCLTAFDEDCERLMGTIALVAGYAGATQIEASYSSKRKQDASIADQHDALNKTGIDVKANGPIQGVPSSVNVKSKFSSEGSDSSAQQVETEQMFSRWLSEKFRKNRRLPNWESKSVDVVRKAGFEDEETINDFIERIRHRAEVEANIDMEHKAKMSLVVRILNKLKWFLGLEPQVKRSRSQDISPDNLIALKMKYKGYKRCKERVSQSRQLSASLSIRATYGPYSGSAGGDNSKKDEIDRTIGEREETATNMEFVVHFRE